MFCFSDCCSDWFDVIVNIPPALSQTCFFHTFNHNTEVLGFTSLVSLSGLVFVFGVCGGVLFSLGVFWVFFFCDKLSFLNCVGFFSALFSSKSLYLEMSLCSSLFLFCCPCLHSSEIVIGVFFFKGPQ